MILLLKFSTKFEACLCYGKKNENTQQVYSNGILSSKRYFDNFNNLIKVENYLISSGEKEKIESVDFYYNNKLCKKIRYIYL